jgi:cyclase
MLKTRVMPCLLSKNGRLVKTAKFKNPAYVGDPVNAIKIYNEKEVDELILVDITATIEQRKPSLELLTEIADECFMPLTYGGGVRDIEDMKRIFGLGIEKIAINSYAFENPHFISQAAALFGSQSVVVSIDARKNWLGRYTVFSHSGSKDTKREPAEYAKFMESMGAGEILLTSIDRDGTMEGYDTDLIKRVTGVVGIPVIACGGAGSVSDFGKAVGSGGASAVAAGSMVVYQGKNRGVLINFPTREELERVLT